MANTIIKLTTVQLRKHTTMLNHWYKDNNLGNFGVVRTNNNGCPNKDDLHRFVSRTAMYKEEQNFNRAQFGLASSVMREVYNLEGIELASGIHMERQANNLVGHRVMNVDMSNTHDDMIVSIGNALNDSVSVAHNIANECVMPHFRDCRTTRDYRIHQVGNDMLVNPMDYITSTVSISIETDVIMSKADIMRCLTQESVNSALSAFNAAVFCFVEVLYSDNHPSGRLVLEHNRNEDRDELMFIVMKIFRSEFTNGTAVSNNGFARLLDLATTPRTSNGFNINLCDVLHENNEIAYGGFQYPSVIQTMTELDIQALGMQHLNPKVGDNIISGVWTATYAIDVVNLKDIQKMVYSNNALTVLRDMVLAQQSKSNGKPLFITFNISLNNNGLLNVTVADGLPTA